MLYTVKYKEESHWFWRTIKNVKGDGMMTAESNFPMRFFITADEERIEVPIPGTQFRFSKERFLSIKQKSEDGFNINDTGKR